jgi:hypothetical protein
VGLSALTIACGGGPKTAPEPAAHSLSGLAAQHIALLPTYMVRLTPGLAWASTMGRPADVKKTLDADILSALEERGIRKSWLLPPDLAQSYKRNTTYAADPYSLAEEPLRSPSIAIETRLAEPLASQIRTLVALHDDVRFVLAPVELRLEAVPAATVVAGTSTGTGSSAAPGMGRGVLRLILLDARLSNVVWVGEISSDPVSAFGPAITASIASKLADVISTQ